MNFLERLRRGRIFRDELLAVVGLRRSVIDQAVEDIAQTSEEEALRQDMRAVLGDLFQPKLPGFLSGEQTDFAEILEKWRRARGL